MFNLCRTLVSSSIKWEQQRQPCPLFRNCVRIKWNSQYENTLNIYILINYKWYYFTLGKGHTSFNSLSNWLKTKQKPLRSSDCRLNCLPYLECYFFSSPSKSFKKLISSMKSSLRPRAFAYPPLNKKILILNVYKWIFSSPCLLVLSLVSSLQALQNRMAFMVPPGTGHSAEHKGNAQEWIAKWIHSPLGKADWLFCLAILMVTHRIKFVLSKINLYQS